LKSFFFNGGSSIDLIHEVWPEEEEPCLSPVHFRKISSLSSKWQYRFHLYFSLQLFRLQTVDLSRYVLLPIICSSKQLHEAEEELTGDATGHEWQTANRAW
jgi:hypothetical protein